MPCAVGPISAASSPQRARLWHPLCEAQVRTRCHALPDPLAVLIDQPALRNLLDAFYLGRRASSPALCFWPGSPPSSSPRPCRA